MAKLYVKVNKVLLYGISGALAIFFVVFRYQLVGLFTNEPQIIRQAGQLMLIIAATTVIQTSALSYTGCLRGAGSRGCKIYCSYRLYQHCHHPSDQRMVTVLSGRIGTGRRMVLAVHRPVCALLAQRNAFPHREMGAHRGLSGITSSECDNESVAVC